jgi:hypothetical protein
MKLHSFVFFLVGIAAIEATEAARGAVAYSNLSGNNYTVGGDNLQFDYGYQFPSTASGNLSDIVMAMGNGGFFNLTLYTDNGSDQLGNPI